MFNPVNYDTFFQLSLIGSAFASVLNFFFEENKEILGIPLNASVQNFPDLLHVELQLDGRSSILLCSRNCLVIQPWLESERLLFVLKELLGSALSREGSPIKNRYFVERLLTFLTTEQAEGLYQLALLEGPINQGGA